MNRCHSIAVLAVLVTTAGCGGGNGPAFPSTTTLRVGINWAARSRTLSAPSSALSVVVTVGAGAPDATDASFTINRDPNPASYLQTYPSPNPVRIGTFPFHARFHAQPDGAGDLVGTVDAQVTIGADGSGVGDIGTVGTVASVAVTSDLVLKVGEKAQPQVEVRDSHGNLLAVSPGSVFLAASAGADHVKIGEGQVEGATAGDTALTASVDGNVSPPKTVRVILRRYLVTDLGTLGGDYVQPSAINNSGQVVGTASLANSDRHAFLWTPNQPNGTTGQMADLGTLPGHKTSVGTAINESGAVVGYSNPATGYSTRAFLWQNGSMQEIHGPPSSTYSDARGISDAGNVLVFSNGVVYLWANGVLTVVSVAYSGGVNIQPVAMAGSGDYIGYSSVGPGGHGSVFGWAVINGTSYGVMRSPAGVNDAGTVIGEKYRWTAGGGLTSLRGLDPNPDDLLVMALNNSTQIVGRSNNEGVILENGVAYALPPMLPPGHQWSIMPSAINDRGQIAGVGSMDGGPNRALLLTPEP